ncbi:MAG: protein-glutamine gamma-glutamyltransferase [Firmicutes bacterium]|nr:protein-glutamine gamma-glutamyltransferase [Bacillota bacterium]
MIIINGNEINTSSILQNYPQNSIQEHIIQMLSESEDTYRYNTLDQLNFESNLRSSTVDAAISLHRSRFSFKVFRESRCNPKYWERTNEGGFILKDGVEASKGINDIYINSSMYGTECATAIVIVFYKAVLDVFKDDAFNSIFPKIHLMNWHYMDPKLGVNVYRNQSEYLPGDCRYVKNPDVDPLTPEWQGENVIDLGNGRYYGHGIGIRSMDEIIRILNRFRKEDATESAYLMDSATRPDYNRLERLYNNYIR